MWRTTIVHPYTEARSFLGVDVQYSTKGMSDYEYVLYHALFDVGGLYMYNQSMDV